MSETKPENRWTPAPMRLIDVADNARQMFGAEGAAEMFPNLPEHDWRFEMVTPTGGTVTFAATATAGHIAEWLKREGVDPSRAQQ